MSLILRGFKHHCNRYTKNDGSTLWFNQPVLKSLKSSHIFIFCPLPSHLRSNPHPGCHSQMRYIPTKLKKNTRNPTQLDLHLRPRLFFLAFVSSCPGACGPRSPGGLGTPPEIEVPRGETIRRVWMVQESQATTVWMYKTLSRLWF